MLRSIPALVNLAVNAPQVPHSLGDKHHAPRVGAAIAEASRRRHRSANTHPHKRGKSAKTIHTIDKNKYSVARRTPAKELARLNAPKTADA